MMYGVVFEESPDGSISAYVPDMPGVGVVGDNRVEAIQFVDRAVQWQAEAMIKDGVALPEPSVGTYEVYISIGHPFVVRIDEKLAQNVVISGVGDTTPFAIAYRRFPALALHAQAAVSA